MGFFEKPKGLQDGSSSITSTITPCPTENGYTSDSSDVTDTSDDIQNHVRGTSRRAIQVCATAGLGGFLYGFSANAISGTLAQTSFINSFLTTADASSRMDGLLATFFGGAFIGSIIQAPVSNKWGRRNANLVAACISIVAGILQSASYQIGTLLVGRIICGVAGGMIAANSPVYMSEVAPPHTRGLLVGFQGIGMGSAYELASICGLVFSFVDNPVQWRLVYIVQTIAAIGFACSLLTLPESPRWLMENGKEGQAIAELEKLHKTKSNPNSALVCAEVVQIKAQVEIARHMPKGYMAIFKTATLRKRALFSIILWTLVQGTGVTAIASIFPVLMRSLGLGNTLQLGLNCAFSGVIILGNVVNSLIVDRFGRVRLLVIGGLSCTILLSVMAALSKFYLNTTYKPGISALIACYFMFVFACTGMLECSAYAYGSEIWPTHLRSEGSTLAFASFFANSLAFSAPINEALATIGWRYYLVFIVVTLVSTATIAVYFPETKNLTLEEISAKFGDPVAVDFKDAMTAEYQGSKNGMKFYPKGRA
ncbi:general substrate transporter [Annulohypoxylon nitens]|nr:general substrate transporter [Annulohypoxylon nitens]